MPSNPAQCRTGRVVRVHGLVCVVRDHAGETHSCHVRRLLKSLEIEGRSVVTVGDNVWFRPGDRAGAPGLIEKVEGRRGVITRGYRNRQHTIAANVNQVLIVSAFSEPGIKLGSIDRYLVAAEIGGVRPVVILNKADLVDLGRYAWVIGMYALLGYETLVTSAADGRGLNRLRELLSAGVTAVTGQSGVGKSSLLNAIQPDLNLKVREVSEWTAKGKHATTTAELIDLEAGGLVVEHSRAASVRALGYCAGRARGLFYRVPSLHPPLSLSRLLTYTRNGMRGQRRCSLGPDSRQPVRELPQALRAAATRCRMKKPGGWACQSAGLLPTSRVASSTRRARCFHRALVTLGGLQRDLLGAGVGCFGSTTRRTPPVSVASTCSESMFSGSVTARSKRPKLRPL